MLILKTKFFIDNWRLDRATASVVMLLLCTLAVLAPFDHAIAAPAHAAASAPRPSRPPDAIATEFYNWYLDTLFADQDPLSDRYPRFTGYVAQDLTRLLVERLQSKPLPQLDYFLQSKTYQPAWRKSVRAAVLRREKASAEVLVTLSGEDAPTQALLLTMVQENGAWKIRRVAPADRSLSESSPEQSVI